MMVLMFVIVCSVGTGSTVVAVVDTVEVSVTRTVVSTVQIEPPVMVGVRFPRVGAFEV